MRILYRTKKLEKYCTIACEAQKKYGLGIAEKLHTRIDDIEASSSVDELEKYRIGGCHRLKGDRYGQYAMDLVHPHRLIFVKKSDRVDIVEIVEIVDYH